MLKLLLLTSLTWTVASFLLCAAFGLALHHRDRRAFHPSGTGSLLGIEEVHDPGFE